MARPKIENLQKHTLNLRAGDMEALAVLFPKQSPSTIVRKIISRFIDTTSSVEEKELPTDEINL